MKHFFLISHLWLFTCIYIVALSQRNPPDSVVNDFNFRTQRKSIQTTIRVNGKLQPGLTYGMLTCPQNNRNKEEMYWFFYQGGLMKFVKSDFDSIKKLHDTAFVKITIVLQSPTDNSWDEFTVCDSVPVKCITRTDYLDILITTIKKQCYKVVLINGKDVHMKYVNIDCKKKRWERRLDKKEVLCYGYNYIKELW